MLLTFFVNIHTLPSSEKEKENHKDEDDGQKNTRKFN